MTAECPVFHMTAAHGPDATVINDNDSRCEKKIYYNMVYVWCYSYYVLLDTQPQHVVTGCVPRATYPFV